jgi:hypothetical protein
MNKFIMNKVPVILCLTACLASCSANGANAYQNNEENPSASSNQGAKTQEKNEISTSSMSCRPNGQLGKYMGGYQVIEVKRYAGGLTSKAQAVSHLGKEMVTLTKDAASVVGNERIKNPVYNISCHRRPETGEVLTPDQRYSDFFGYGINRKVISILEVKDPLDKDPTPYYEFEIIKAEDKIILWFMEDGWLYTLAKNR